MNILIVCTGNTCRSPAAEIILKSMIKKQGLADKIKVSSAGIYAQEGDIISYKMVDALKELGYAATKSKKARQLTMDMLKKADLILTATKSHKNMLPQHSKIKSIGELSGLGDIPDPYGLGAEVYLQTAQNIEKAMSVVLERLKSMI